MQKPTDFLPILNFLGELSQHNEKTWFEAHRPAYESVRQDFEGFIDGLIDALRSSDALQGLSAKECISRIYRDIRFTRDKSPYHTNFSAIIAPGGRKSTRQGYYISIQPGGYSLVAGGLYMPSPEQLNLFRQAINRNAARFKAITGSTIFVDMFGKIDGDRLKSAPKGYERSHPEIELLQLKQVTALHYFQDKQVLEADFP
jgi:uncharacterized protein (TIGR02453 family)